MCLSISYLSVIKEVGFRCELDCFSLLLGCFRERNSRVGCCCCRRHFPYCVHTMFGITPICFACSNILFCRQAEYLHGHSPKAYISCINRFRKHFRELQTIDTFICLSDEKHPLSNLFL